MTLSKRQLLEQFRLTQSEWEAWIEILNSGLCPQKQRRKALKSRTEARLQYERVLTTIAKQKGIHLSRGPTVFWPEEK